MTGSAVIPWVQSTGFAQLYMRFYRTNDNQSNSAQVMKGLKHHAACTYSAAVHLGSTLTSSDLEGNLSEVQRGSRTSDRGPRVHISMRERRQSTC